MDPDRPFHPNDEPDASLPTGADEPDTAPTIVVGIDGSAQSRAALHWAMRYAQLIEGRVEAVAVWHQPIQFGDGPAIPSVDFESQARQWLADALPDQPHQHINPEPPVHTYLEQGDPSHVLLDHARKAEVLVLGNHGRGSLRAMVLGSVAQRCVHHARCPVLLMPHSS